MIQAVQGCQIGMYVRYEGRLRGGKQNKGMIVMVKERTHPDSSVMRSIKSFISVGVTS